MRWGFWMVAMVQGAAAATDFWDLPPILYSDTEPINPLTQLSSDLASGRRSTDGTSLERLRFILKELKVPESSQVLVFSKTSLQNPLIHPANPRSLFFSEDTYVGYVPGGEIEIIIHDPLLGPVFYRIESTGLLKIERDLTSCISCHATSNTEGVPGMQVRSVFPDEGGRPLFAMGTTQVGPETPLAERWGGYYVTGRSSLPHLGNRTYQKGGAIDPRTSDLRDLANQLDVTKYPRPTSDIVALLVLEHQCRMHNLLTSAALQYRRAHYLGRAVDPQADPDLGTAGRIADGLAEKIAASLFFQDEADPGEGIEGGEEFQKSLANRFPRTREGDSLADFQLYTRLFKHRCSFMVYSSAFRSLPPRVKAAVFREMRTALAGDPKYPWLKPSERAKISTILTETLPGWPIP